MLTVLNTRRLEANRANAQRSTGPRSLVGINASSRNALSHGLSAVSMIVIDSVEDPAEYEAMVSAVIADLDACGIVETILAQRIAQLFWRLRRVMRFETESLSQWQAGHTPEPGPLAVQTAAMERSQRMTNALGDLLLAGKVELDSDTVLTIREALVEYLADEERAFLKGRRGDALARFLFGTPSRQTFKVGAVRMLFRVAENRLREMPQKVRPFRGAGEGNLIAKVYKFWIFSGRQWRLDEEQDGRVRARQRTQGLLLQVERIAIVERYEPRLRRDLSRSLRDLRDLQETRRGRSLWDSTPRGSAESRFSQNEPIAISGS
jgi:hypothetical protein